MRQSIIVYGGVWTKLHIVNFVISARVTTWYLILCVYGGVF